MVIVYSSRGKACKNSQTFKITANFMGPANFQASQQLKEESLHFKRRTSMATQHPTATRTPDCNSVEPAFVCRALASCNRATLHGQPHQTLRSQPSIWRPLYATCRAVHQRSTAAAADTRMKATNMSKNVAGFKVLNGTTFIPQAPGPTVGPTDPQLFRGKMPLHTHSNMFGGSWVL